jgi:hypothetical protein
MTDQKGAAKRKTTDVPWETPAAPTGSQPELPSCVTSFFEFQSNLLHLSTKPEHPAFESGDGIIINNYSSNTIALSFKSPSGTSGGPAISQFSQATHSTRPAL